MLKHITVPILAAALLTSPLARAQDPAPMPESAPEPVKVEPMTRSATACPPLDFARRDKDFRPGRGKRIAGGLMITVGLAGLAVGTGMAVWSAMREVGPGEFDTANNRDAAIIGSAVGATLGGLMMIGGIPLVVSGRAEAREAQARIAFGPTGGPGMGGLANFRMRY